MHTETQFSIFLINKPGVLAQTLNALAEEKVNIIAMTMMDSVEHGVLRLVSPPTQTREALQQINVPFDETEVLCVTLSNQSGALATVTNVLAQAHININYAYCTSGAKGGRTTAVLKVADIKKAKKVLAAELGYSERKEADKRSGKKKQTKTVRRNNRPRR